MQELSKPASNMIVYVAESRTVGGLAELVYQDDVACNAHTGVLALTVIMKWSLAKPREC